jgi:hypothetical protein
MSDWAIEHCSSVMITRSSSHVGGGFTLWWRGSRQGVFPAEILCEPAVELRHILTIDPRDIDKHPKSRDLQVSGLYNFNIQLAMVCPISFGESS